MRQKAFALLTAITACLVGATIGSLLLAVALDNSGTALGVGLLLAFCAALSAATVIFHDWDDPR